MEDRSFHALYSTKLNIVNLNKKKRRVVVGFGRAKRLLFASSTSGQNSSNYWLLLTRTLRCMRLKEQLLPWHTAKMPLGFGS